MAAPGAALWVQTAPSPPPPPAWESPALGVLGGTYGALENSRGGTGRPAGDCREHWGVQQGPHGVLEPFEASRRS